ncbi:MAG: hypothetical protein CSB55_08665 [Candidatus Cloacimonadota bacterium]|nr:MAG: hypothetical protein CSB55_08665 [Candidatus Cloacimonadota bacterium]
MNILFDFQHPVDVNFFKNTINTLKNDNHNIFLAFRPRGSLERILRYELPGFPVFSFGKHGKNIVSKLCFNLLREKELLKFYKDNKIELTCGFGPLTTISSKVFGIPSLAFEDDYEYKINFYYAKLFATRHIMPKIFPANGKNVHFFNGFKELAYLHPNYYKPDPGALEEYGLAPDEYVFVREVANISLNYQNKKNNIFELIEMIKSLGLKTVLSLEDKSLKNKLEKDCIILKEPVKDINSILAFAKMAITSGDTMAREASLLGTYTIYTGNREMLIHEDFYKIGIMFNEISREEIIGRVKSVLEDKNDKQAMKDKIDSMIINKWDDMTKVILKHINDFTGNKK